MTEDYKSKKAQTIKTYDAAASAFAKKFDDMPARIADIKETFRYSKCDYPAVLEIGCGSGRDAEHIVMMTDEYLGIDISSELVRIAKDKVPKGRFEVADIEEYDFPLGFDIVFAFASLIHVNAPALWSIFRKIHDRLNESALVRISMKGAPQYCEVMSDDGAGPRTYYHYSESDIGDLARDTSFQMLKLDTIYIKEQGWIEAILQKA